jgi:hypothetical protein
MISYLTSRSFWRMTGTASLATVMLIIGSGQAIGDPGTSFKITWSACEKSPQTQCGTLKVPVDWSNRWAQPSRSQLRAIRPRTGASASAPSSSTLEGQVTARQSMPQVPRRSSRRP